MQRISAPVLDLETPEARTCRDCGHEFVTKWRLQRICNACVDQRRRLTAEDLREERVMRHKAQLAAMGLSGRLAAEMPLERFRPEVQPEGWDAAQTFIERFPNGNLALLGRPGSGKTHLAVGIMLALREQCVAGQYVHVPSLFSALKRAPDRSEAEMHLLNPLFDARLLVLDDVGREKSTEHMAEWLDVLINGRWVDRLPTVIAANLSQAALTEWLGGAGASRFISEADVVEMRPVDARIQKLPPRPVRQQNDPSQPCLRCSGVGWLLDTRMPVGSKERAIQCSACAGRGW